MEDDILSEAWPKEFAELKELEKLLRCNICKDFMKTSLITGCSHLFCSYCVRQSIQYRNQCPACFAELYDNQLRPERTLDEVIRIFTSVKRKLLKRLQISYAACPGDEEDSKAPDKKEQAKPSPAPPPPITPGLLFNSPLKSSTPLAVKPRTVPSMFSPKSVPQTKLFSTVGVKREPESKPSEPSRVGSSGGNVGPSVSSSFTGSAGRSGSSTVSGTSSLPLGKSVPCPVCSVEIPERNINLHLDECLARANGAPPKSQPQNKPTRKPLPKLVLSLMKEKDLKSKCKDHGLSTLGDRKSLISRIQRFTTLYNSECDSLSPRSKEEIVRQIEREEKSLTTSVKPLFSQVDRKTDPKVIEEVHTKYLQDNKSAFQKLIENMKERNGTRIVRSPRPSANRILSDEEEDVNPRPSGCESNSTGAETKFLPTSTNPSTQRTSDKTAPKTLNSSLTEKRKHLPPLSPEIQIAPLSPQADTSSESPSYTNHNVPTTNSFPPSLSNHSSATSNSSSKEKEKSSVKSTPLASPREQVRRSESPDFMFLPSSSPPNRQLFTPSPTLPSKNQSSVQSTSHASLEEQSARSNVKSISAPPVEQTESGVKSTNLASPKERQVRRSESPDLFMADDAGDMDMFFADNMEEESAGENTREQCASPDLLATMNRSCSSRSSQITTSGHFVDSDSESELNTNNTIVNSYHGNFESVVKSSDSNSTQPSQNKASASSSYSNKKSSYQSKSKQSDCRHDNVHDRSHDNGMRIANEWLGGGDSDDEEDFLQIVQNKRMKRKPKELVFSPRATRSKKMKP